MRKSLIILALGALVWLTGSVQNTAADQEQRTADGTGGMEEALFRFGVPFADLPGPDVSDLPEQYQQMVHRLLSIPPSERPPMQACFYPGTDPKVVERVTQLLYSPPSNPLDYYLGGRWSTTANGSTGSQGNPIVITYSFVPDGVSIPGGVGEATSNNVLNATMNSLFGSAAVWKPKFAQCFARWAALTGVTYQEVSDDGASFSGSGGVLGSRGDVRIAAHPIDGVYNILAYTYFPNNGDMVLDSAEPWSGSSGDYIFFRNIVMHEHGHGLGLQHVCPLTNTKLLEPYLATNFDGPQHDDIRAGQRNYGDRYENNDASGTATNLGSVGNGTTNVNDVGTDNAADTDWYKFTVAANKRITATMTPVGATYYSDPQNGDGSCPSPTTQLNTLDDQNIDLRLYSTDGTTILYNANTQAAGVAETVPVTNLTAAGTYYLRVLNNSANDVVQLYNLAFTISDIPTPNITVTAPNGSEIWYTGEQHNLTWTTYSIAGNVKIELSRNYNPAGGSTWETLFASTANDSTEPWTVSGAVSAAARVRITSVNVPTIGDTSNANFTIATPWVTVTAPNGGEAWVTFESRTIFWNSAGFTDNVKVELTRSYNPSGGSTWETLFAGTANDGSEPWTVAGSATAARVRISRASNSAIADTSNSNFTITMPTITVTAPTTAVTWYVGESKSITWTSALLTGNMKIELTRNYNPGGGSTWELLYDNSNNDGTETWPVSGAATTTARMRVSSYSYPSVGDTSDVNFAIASPFIHVDAPNGGEAWVVGTGPSITWSSGGVTGNVVIELNRSYAVGVWETLFASTPNDGSQAWTVTSPVTSMARVRITSVTTPTATDVSDANFTIQGQPPVLAHDPLGDILTGTGTITAIATSPQSSIGSVKMFYRLSGATLFDSLVLNTTGNPNEYARALSTLASGAYQYYVRATDVVGLSTYLPSNAPTGLYAFDVGTICGSTIAYDDGSADKFSWSEGTPGVGTEWAVKFGPVTVPYVICAAQFAASRSLPDAAHTPIHLYVYAADGAGGSPGTLIQDVTTGSVGNVIGGLPSGTNWARALLKDDLGNALVVNNSDFYVAVANDSVGKYEAFGRDTTSANAHRSYFYDPCAAAWFSEDAIGNSSAHPGNRMLRVWGYTLASPTVVIYVTADTLHLAWTNTQASQYTAYYADNIAGPWTLFATTNDTTVTVNPTISVPSTRFFKVQSKTN